MKNKLFLKARSIPWYYVLIGISIVLFGIVAILLYRDARDGGLDEDQVEYINKQFPTTNETPNFDR